MKLQVLDDLSCKDTMLKGFVQNSARIGVEFSGGFAREDEKRVIAECFNRNIKSAAWLPGVTGKVPYGFYMPDRKRIVITSKHSPGAFDGEPSIASIGTGIHECYHSLGADRDDTLCQMFNEPIVFAAELMTLVRYLKSGQHKGVSDARLE